MNARWNHQSGFTLIELLVVVIILGVLSALAMPAYSGIVRRARYGEAKHHMGTMAKEVQIYRVEEGSYPPDVVANTQPEGVENWPETADIPYESFYDYDHWGVGGNQCYVQIGYAGESGVSTYPKHQLNKKPPGFREFGDNLVLGVALYDCAVGGGPIK
ncbi:MAG: prepilin-type N-terminal cleavage/methylation domain-containing protein [Cyanobacteria bacterium P01_F01_bin.86]